MNYLKSLLSKAGAIMALSVLFISCTTEEAEFVINEPEATEASVFGEWKAIGYVYDGVYNPIADECQQEVLKIFEDGTAVSIKHCPDGDVTANLTWTHNGGDVYGFDSEATYWPVTYHLTFPEGNNKMYSIYTEPQPHSFAKVYQRQ